MFRKLQRELMVLNISLISAVTIFALATVYITTKRSIQLENERIMGAQSMTEVGEIVIDGESPVGTGSIVTHRVSSDYSLSFSVEIDIENNVLSVLSTLNLDEGLYEEAARLALAQNKTDGYINIGNRDWMYRIESSTFITHYSSDQGYGAQGVTMGEQRHISFIDVTESKKAAQNLLIILFVVGGAMLIVFYVISRGFSRRAVKPVAEAWERQKRFIADASHELKTPLAIINAGCDALIINRDETIDSQMKWLNGIQAGTDRMSSLIIQLLALAKSDAINNIQEAANADVSRIVSETAGAMGLVANDRGIRFSCEIEKDITVCGDSEKITHIFSILLDNAVKYAGSYVSVKLVKNRKSVCFTVENDGEGINGEDMPKIFERFYRGDKSRNGGDSFGLGLSIAKNLTESLNGKITAESKPGEYTVFTVHFGG